MFLERFPTCFLLLSILPLVSPVRFPTHPILCLIMISQDFSYFDGSLSQSHPIMYLRHAPRRSLSHQRVGATHHLMYRTMVSSCKSSQIRDHVHRFYKLSFLIGLLLFPSSAIAPVPTLQTNSFSFFNRCSLLACSTVVEYKNAKYANLRCEKWPFLF